MWTKASLKCPQERDWLAVVRVTPDGDTRLVIYLDAAPEDVEQELAAVQQHWTQREVWPDDAEIQAGARIRDYVKYPEEAREPYTVTHPGQLLGVRARIGEQEVNLHPADVELVYGVLTP